MTAGRNFRWIGLVLVFHLAGCATYNAATGRNEFIFIPTDQEVVMGRDIHRQLLAQNRLVADKGMTDRIHRIGQRLAQVSDRQDYEYHFYVIEQKDLNAFTVPGGNIYINSGLVNKLSSEDEIAGVLAHEIGHCAARHTIKKFQAAMGYNLIGDLILSQIGDQHRRLTALGANAVMDLVFSAYGRQDEYDADRLSVKYLSLAGYDPQGMVKALEVLKKESKDGKTPLLLRSHPFLDDRITAVKKEIEKLN